MSLVTPNRVINVNAMSIWLHGKSGVYNWWSAALVRVTLVLGGPGFQSWPFMCGSLWPWLSVALALCDPGSL